MGKQKYIRIQGELIAVTEEVYLEYYRMNRREKAQVEKDKRHGLVYYSCLDNDEITGEDALQDKSAYDLQDIVTEKLMAEQLHKCIALLNESESDLIKNLFFRGLTERELSKNTGIPQKTINDRKLRALKKLKKFLENKK